MKIEHYPNYEIFQDGRVKNIKTERFLTQHIDTTGYYKVTLSKKGKQKTFRIHRLIGKVFLENPNNYKTIDHINRNKLDNRLDNLRWASSTTQRLNQKNRKNKLNEHNISIRKNYKKKYCVQIRRPNINICKLFYTLEEAKAYRNNILSN